MYLKLIAATLLLSLSAFASSARAQSIDSNDELASLASQANVNVTDLKGAAYSTGLTAREYLYAVGELSPPAPQPDAATHRGYALSVRLTYYTYNSGVTYSNETPYVGGAACSWNIPLGAHIQLPGGPTLVCNDRGLLGTKGWVDVYAQPGLVRAYGNYVTVEILP